MIIIANLSVLYKKKFRILIINLKLFRKGLKVSEKECDVRSNNNAMVLIRGFKHTWGYPTAEAGMGPRKFSSGVKTLHR